MSSRFDNLIKLVVDRFEYSEYNLLLTEALSLVQIQDQLKEKGIDLNEYNPKHYLFLLALLNSNLNLDVYNQITTSIKDQGILNRLMSQTVDKKSNEPTVDPELINRVLHNTSNIPELNAILNSLTQNRGEKASNEPKEYAEGQSPAERYLAAAKKMVEDYSVRIYKRFNHKFSEEKKSSTLKVYYDLLEPYKKKYPDDRLIQNNVYLMALTNLLLNCITPNGDVKYDFNVEKVKEIIDIYFSYPDLIKQNVIFNDPYKDDFIKFANYVYKYDNKQQTNVSSSEKPEENEEVYKDENITVYLGTVESHGESMRRCIKYGQGAKYGLCISTKNLAGNYYSKYRLDPAYQGDKINLTTYFVYFNNDKVKNKYGANKTVEFVLIDAYNKNDEEKTSHQYNPASPNNEYQVSDEELAKLYPIVKNALEQGVFKSIKPTDKENREYNRSKMDATMVNSARDLIYLAMHRPEQLQNTETLNGFSINFPEVMEYVLEIIFEKLTTAYDDTSQSKGYFKQYKDAIISNGMKKFLEQNKQYQYIADKFIEDNDYKSFRATVMIQYRPLELSDLNEAKEKYPNKLKDIIKAYINSKTENFTGISNPGDRIKHDYTKVLIDFLNDNPKLKELKDKEETLFDTVIKFKNLIISFIGKTAARLADFNFTEFAKSYPDAVKDIFDSYVKHKLEFYTEAGNGAENEDDVYTLQSKMDHIDNYDLEEFIFGHLRYTLIKYPDLGQKYFETRKNLKLQSFENNGKSGRVLDYNYLTSVEEKMPEVLEQGLDIYIGSKLKYSNEDQYDYSDDDDGYNDSSNGKIVHDRLDRVFSYMGDFYTKHKDYFKKYDNLIISHKKEIIRKLSPYEILNSEFFENTKQILPDQVKSILKYYIETKYESIESLTNKYTDTWERKNKYKDFADGDIDGFIFKPLKQFIEDNKDLFTEYNPKRKETAINYLKYYLGIPRIPDYYMDHGEHNDPVLITLDSIEDYQENKFRFLNTLIKEIEDRHSKSFSSVFGDDDVLFLYVKLKHLILGARKNEDYGEILPRHEKDIKTFENLIRIRKDKVARTFSQLFLKVITGKLDDKVGGAIGHVGLDNMLEYLLDEKENDLLPSLLLKVIPTLPNIILSYLGENLKDYKNFNLKKPEIILQNLIKDIFNNSKLYGEIQNNKILEHTLFKAMQDSNILSNEILSDKYVEMYIKTNHIDMARNMYNNYGYINLLNLLKKYKVDLSDNKICVLFKKLDSIHNNKIIDRLEKLIDEKKTKIIDNKTYYIIDESYSINSDFYYDAPDYSKYIFNNVRDIGINTYSIIKTFKWLPKYVSNTGSKTKEVTLRITNATITQIDHIPKGVNRLYCTGIETPDELAIINVDVSSIESIILNQVYNLKRFKNFNNFTKLKMLTIGDTKDLETLEGFSTPSEILHLNGMDHLNSFKMQNGNCKKIEIEYTKVNNFIGIPKSDNYSITNTIIYSFKGLPNSIRNFHISDSSSFYSSNKSRCDLLFPVNEYDYFPKYINNFTISKSVENCLAGKLKDKFPLTSKKNKEKWLQSSHSAERILDTRRDKAVKKHTKDEKLKTRLKAAELKRIPTKEDEIEAIERQQDKAANRERIKRLRKEELETITPFNVLLEDILNTIKTSFKVYK